MSQLSGTRGSKLKPNFLRSFLLNYHQALGNSPNKNILAHLKDWNCQRLLRLNIAISEVVSTLKDNCENILPYRGTIFTNEFIQQIENFVYPMTDRLRRLDNKNRFLQDPSVANDKTTN